MGLIVLAAFAGCVVAIVRFLQVLARRIDADMAAGSLAVVAADADVRTRNGRWSERELRRRSRMLIDEVELFLASQGS